MKIYQALFLSIVVLLMCLSISHAGERGTWVVRFDIDTPEKVHRICTKENQQQFDRFLVQVRGRADSWYESSFVPKAEGLDDFDPLAAILAECTDVEVHAWVNVYYLWTGDTPPVDPAHPYYHDEWILHDRTGRSVKDYSEIEQRQHWIEGVYADPASPEYRAYFTRVVRELTEKYEVRGVHLDFVRYPGSFFGDSTKPTLTKMTRQEFAQWHNKSGDAATQALLGERLAWEQQRSDHVTSLVRDVKEVMTQVNPQLKLSASVFPDIVEAFLDKGQKWVDWLKDDLLDEVYVMAYFGTPARVQSQISQCQTICDTYGVKMWVGLGAYIKSAEDIRSEIFRASQAGACDICLFSLGHLLKQKKNVSRYQLSHGSVVQAAPPAAELPALVTSVLVDDFHLAYADYADLALPQRSIQLRGIFRYVDAHDDYVKVQEQYEIMQDVQHKLQSGTSFTKLSRKYSQAGTKRHGGQLPNLTCAEARTARLQGLFKLKPGDYTDIVPVYNGFWIFQIL